MSRDTYAGIQQSFVHPHDTNKIWAYYYWIGDDISREGVTRDLEAMARFGLEAVLIGNINPDEVDGPVPLFSEEWWDIMVHTVEEGHRLGIDIGFFNCPGWSQSGGPWVTYDKAMRHVVYSETDVTGPAEEELELKKPAEEFQDLYVLAFPSIAEEEERLDNTNAEIHTDPTVENPEYLLDGDMETEVLLDIRNTSEYTFRFKSAEPITARSIKMFPGSPDFKCTCTLYSEVDGVKVQLRTFDFDRSNSRVNVGPVTKGPVSLTLQQTTSDTYILECYGFSRGAYAGFAEIVISEAPVLERYVEKTLGKMHPTPFPDFDSYMWEMQGAVADDAMRVSRVLDISDRMDPDGRLRWEVPDGSWKILRFGMTPTGTKNSPAAPQGKGYEIDKASAELAAYHFEQYIGEILKRIPEESRPAFKYVIADSYEMGSQNWTDDFAEKFEKKFGYDPVRFLPVFSGRIVGSVEESERFLWDLRRAVADDVAYEYVGGLRKVSNAHGLQVWLENYGHWGYPGEFLMYGGQSDLVGGEYWNEGSLGNIECKSASSAAHIYGKPITYAEAFTASGQAYKRHPAMLKKRGDWALTEGINQYVLHLYIHQPDDARIPGINAWFSTEFNRHNTWFDQGRHWVDYLRRCQHMLQQGKYAADVCYFIGEDVPKMTGARNPELPPGYSYDYINAEVILNRLSVSEGKFVLPDGMSYSLMVLPPVNIMRPEVLRKIEALVQAGGAVLGPRPGKSPSLQNYPDCDEEVQKLAGTLWDHPYADGSMIGQHGKGHIMDGIGVRQALELLEVPKDVILVEDTPLLWTHRTMPGMEMYFMSNQSSDTVYTEPSFRVSGLQPQLWDATTGAMRQLNQYTSADGRTVVPLRFLPLQSWFIVFTNTGEGMVSPGYAENFPEIQNLAEIDTEWQVDFVNKDIGPKKPLRWRKLQDWTTFDNDSIKYYSGTVLYETEFLIEALPETDNIFLDVGNVGVMAEVVLNGQELGGVWIAPYVLPAGEALIQGKNTLEVRVVNLWRNRLVGDLNVPEEDRYTWTVVSDAKPGEALEPSGLLGPVSVRYIAK